MYIIMLKCIIYSYRYLYNLSDSNGNNLLFISIIHDFDQFISGITKIVFIIIAYEYFL